jgi:hypothetical protein
MTSGLISIPFSGERVGHGLFRQAQLRYFL